MQKASILKRRRAFGRQGDLLLPASSMAPTLNVPNRAVYSAITLSLFLSCKVRTVFETLS